MSSSTWALSQISQLLPLDEESLRQILDYTSTLTKDAAAEHLKNLLGDSPKALEFISSYNARRGHYTSATLAAAAAPEAPEAPKSSRKTHKKKAPLNKLPPPRQVEDYGNTQGAYQKKDEGDYMARKQRARAEPALAKTLALSEQPDAVQLPKTTTGSSAASTKPPPSAAGPLISDLPNVRSGSRTSSRTSSPAPKAKINVPGGASMHGASTTLQDLVRSFFFPFPFSSRPKDLLTTHPPTGLRDPRPRTPNQPFPLHEPLRPPLHLPSATPSSPSRRAQLPELRKDYMRKRGHRPLYLLRPCPSLLSRNNIHDRLSKTRAGSREDERQQRDPPSR